MIHRSFRILPVIVAAAVLGACASDGSGGLFTTSSVAPAAIEPAVATARPKTDPQCVTLASQINTLRQEGTIERLEKVATGKSTNVQVKRTAIAKQAELNKANADFQVKCAPRIPSTQEAAVVPTVAPATGSPVAAAVSNAAAAKTAVKAAASGVTAVAPKAQ